MEVLNTSVISRLTSICNRPCALPSHWTNPPGNCGPERSRTVGRRAESTRTIPVFPSVVQSAPFLQRAECGLALQSIRSGPSSRSTMWPKDSVSSSPAMGSI